MKNPKRLLVIEESGVGERKACKACDEPLQGTCILLQIGNYPSLR
jgi:hypothetical protein